MGVILDTSVLVAAERDRFDLEALLAAQAPAEVAMAAITASELLHGVQRAVASAHRERRERFIEYLLANLPTIPFTLDTARRHATLWVDLEQRGTVIGSHDLLIAATALEGGHAIATLNRREFERVPDLALVNVDTYRRP